MIPFKNILRLLTFFVLLVSVSSCAQTTETNSGNKIHWMSFEQAVKENEKQPKKIFIDVYTNWCGWCKRMDATTFEDSIVVEYMNKNFYAVKLNAETKDTIHFQDKIFTYVPENKSNQLALSLLNGKMSYPTSVYLDEKFSMLGPSPGYQTTEQIMPILKYMGENIYKTMTWEEYQKAGYKN